MRSFNNSWDISTIKMRAIIYARCSTDEKKQDVEVQLKQLRAYCKSNNWNHDEISEYASGSKKVPDKLREILNLINKRLYNVFIVFSLDRFSRLHPSTTNKMMDYTIKRNCRFISLQENIDSENEMTWHIIRHFFQYMAWIYSKNLSEKTKLGMKRAKEKGKNIGRPIGSKDKKQRSKKGYYLKQKQRLPF